MKNQIPENQTIDIINSDNPTASEDGGGYCRGSKRKSVLGEFQLLKQFLRKLVKAMCSSTRVETGRELARCRIPADLVGGFQNQDAVSRLGQRMRDDRAKWARVIKEFNVKAED